MRKTKKKKKEKCCLSYSNRTLSFLVGREKRKKNIQAQTQPLSASKEAKSH